MLPAPSQGAIGIETLADNKQVAGLMAAIGDRATEICVAAERRLLEGLGGDCHTPVAGLAECDGESIRLRAEILTNDGTEGSRGEARFARDDRDAPPAWARHLLDTACPALGAPLTGLTTRLT